MSDSSATSTEYKLVFQGLTDSSAQALQRVKGILIADLDLSVSDVQSILQGGVREILKAKREVDLLRAFKALKGAGADVLIVRPIEQRDETDISIYLEDNSDGVLAAITIDEIMLSTDPAPEDATTIIFEDLFDEIEIIEVDPAPSKAAAAKPDADVPAPPAIEIAYPIVSEKIESQPESALELQHEAQHGLQQETQLETQTEPEISVEIQATEETPVTDAIHVPDAASPAEIPVAVEVVAASDEFKIEFSADIVDEAATVEPPPSATSIVEQVVEPVIEPVHEAVSGIVPETVCETAIESTSEPAIEITSTATVEVVEAPALCTELEPAISVAESVAVEPTLLLTHSPLASEPISEPQNLVETSPTEVAPVEAPAVEAPTAATPTVEAATVEIPMVEVAPHEITPAELAPIEVAPVEIAAASEITATNEITATVEVIQDAESHATMPLESTEILVPATENTEAAAPSELTESEMTAAPVFESNSDSNANADSNSSSDSDSESNPSPPSEAELDFTLSFTPEVATDPEPAPDSEPTPNSMPTTDSIPAITDASPSALTVDAAGTPIEELALNFDLAPTDVETIADTISHKDTTPAEELVIFETTAAADLDSIEQQIEESERISMPEPTSIEQFASNTGDLEMPTAAPVTIAAETAELTAELAAPAVEDGTKTETIDETFTIQPAEPAPAQVWNIEDLSVALEEPPPLHAEEAAREALLKISDEFDLTISFDSDPSYSRKPKPKSAIATTTAATTTNAEKAASTLAAAGKSASDKPTSELDDLELILEGLDSAPTTGSAQSSTTNPDAPPVTVDTPQHAGEHAAPSPARSAAHDAISPDEDPDGGIVLELDVDEETRKELEATQVAAKAAAAKSAAAKAASANGAAGTTASKLAVSSISTSSDSDLARLAPTPVSPDAVPGAQTAGNSTGTAATEIAATASVPSATDSGNGAVRKVLDMLRDLPREVTVAIVSGIMILGGANWIYFKFVAPSERPQISIAIPKTADAPKTKARTAEPQGTPMITAHFRGESTIDRLQVSGLVAFAGNEPVGAHMAVMGPEPAPRTADEIVHDIPSPPWLKRVEIDTVKFTDIGNGRHLAGGSAKVYIEFNDRRGRLTAPATLTVTNDQAQGKVLVEISIAHNLTAADEQNPSWVVQPTSTPGAYRIKILTSMTLERQAEIPEAPAASGEVSGSEAAVQPAAPAVPQP